MSVSEENRVKEQIAVCKAFALAIGRRLPAACQSCSRRYRRSSRQQPTVGSSSERATHNSAPISLGGKRRAKASMGGSFARQAAQRHTAGLSRVVRALGHRARAERLRFLESRSKRQNAPHRLLAASGQSLATRSCHGCGRFFLLFDAKSSDIRTLCSSSRYASKRSIAMRAAAATTTPKKQNRSEKKMTFF